MLQTIGLSDFRIEDSIDIVLGALQQFRPQVSYLPLQCFHFLMFMPIWFGIDQLRQSFHHFLDALSLEIAALAQYYFSNPPESFRVYLVGFPL